MSVLNERDARLLLGRIFTMRLPRDIGELDLDRFPLGNYIVFRDALKASFEDSKQQIDAAKRKIRQHGVEPVFMMDEEGGRVTQISECFPSAPSAAAVSEQLEPAEARALYRHMSETLADLGIDINLAPCVDACESNHRVPCIRKQTGNSRALRKGVHRGIEAVYRMCCQALPRARHDHGGFPP